MYRALALKELRELWWAGAIAMAILAHHVFDAIGLSFDLETLRVYVMHDRRHIPFLSSDTRGMVVLTAAALALALGFWQTLGESVRGTWPFLLHRPMARRSMVLTKLATGMGLLLVSTGVPIVFYAMWAATPGTHASPFEWWMTVETWRGWFLSTAVYLAAFLCGIREARWYGSRLWPLVPVLLLALAVTEFGTLPLGTMTVVLDAALLGAVLGSSHGAASS